MCIYFKNKYPILIDNFLRKLILTLKNKNLYLNGAFKADFDLLILTDGKYFKTLSI